MMNALENIGLTSRHSELGSESAWMLKRVQHDGTKTNLNKAQEAATDFEAFFLSRMMESMFEGVATDGLFGGGHAEKIYRSLLLDEYGKTMARTGNVGIADSVMSAIIKMQEAQGQEAQI